MPKHSDKIRDSEITRKSISEKVEVAYTCVREKVGKNRERNGVCKENNGHRYVLLSVIFDFYLTICPLSPFFKAKFARNASWLLF